MVKVSTLDIQDPMHMSLPRLSKEYTSKDHKVKRLGVGHPTSDTVDVIQLRQYLHPVAAKVKPKVKEENINQAMESVERCGSPDSKVTSSEDLVQPECMKSHLCESRSDDKSKGVFCKCEVCGTVPKKLPKLIYKQEQNTLGVSPRLLTQLQLSHQMSMLRAMQDLNPVQMYSTRMIRFKLMQNHRRQTMPMRLAASSSSTPTVPYSTADILYGNEVRHSSPQLEELRQNSLLEFGKDKERLSSKDSGEQNTGRRPSSKGASRKSLSIEKVSFGNKESEDNLRPLLPSSKQNNQYRPNGMRNSLLRGEPSYSARNNVSGKETDDLIAMGTIWSPNTQQGQQGSQMAPLSNSSKSSNLAIANNMNGTASSTSQGIGRSIGVGTNGSSSTTTLSQGARKYNSAVKPILVQNAPSSGSKNSVDPKYTDPLIGAPASFQQRLMELSALEAETVRYERSKKVKKKVKQDRDS